MKERERNDSLLKLFPSLFSNPKDTTQYIPIKQDTTSGAVNNKTAVETNQTNKSQNFENNKKDFKFDPWKREMEIDSLSLYNSNKNGRYEKGEFEYINKSKFNSVIGNSFDLEGGYSNNRHDRGGETNHGITRIFMEQYKNALPEGKAKPIKDITKEDAYNMYNAMWNQHNLGHVKDKNIAFLLNDYMINSNEWKVAKRVQDILNQKGHSIIVDGLFGPKTLEAINNTDKKWLIEEILQDRYKNYRKQVQDEQSQIHNFKGWINRLNKIAELVGSKTRFPLEY